LKKGIHRGRYDSCWYLLSKFAVAQLLLVATADRKAAWEFLQHMLEAVPYQVHTVLTDNVLCRERNAA
jgi:hypothetical protein